MRLSVVYFKDEVHYATEEMVTLAEISISYILTTTGSITTMM